MNLALLIFAIVFGTILLATLAWSDRECVARGGQLVVISERQAKGTMNHTECHPLPPHRG